MQVRGGRIARHISQRIALARFLGFEQHHRRAFTEREAIALRIKRTRNAAGGQGVQAVEAREDQPGERIVATGEHAPGATRADHVGGPADGVGTGGAGIGNDDDRATPAELGGDAVHLPLRLIMLRTRKLGGNTSCILPRVLKVGLAQRHRPGGGADDQRIDAFHVLTPAWASASRMAMSSMRVPRSTKACLCAGNAVKQVSLGQIDHAGGLGDEPGRVKKPDRPERGAIRRQRLLIRLPANAQRRDDPGSGDGDALARRGGGTVEMGNR
jgi:hypothetical protein